MHENWQDQEEGGTVILLLDIMALQCRLGDWRVKVGFRVTLGLGVINLGWV